MTFFLSFTFIKSQIAATQISNIQTIRRLKEIQRSLTSLYFDELRLTSGLLGLLQLATSYSWKIH